MTTKQRFEHILGWFETHMPVAESELVYRNPYELLVAVMLSAQCTDKRVNMVTPALFEAYPTAQALAQATEDEVFEYVKSVSYPRSKSQHLVQMAQRLVTAYGGEVPDSIEELQTLQGVGRKTANVIQSVAFGKATLAVDTHVFRVAHRLGLVNKSDNTPYKVEMALTKYIPEEDMWITYAKRASRNASNAGLVPIVAIIVSAAEELQKACGLMLNGCRLGRNLFFLKM